MGITIRYLASAAADTAFTYAVERRRDGAVFDFAQELFRPPWAVPADASGGPLEVAVPRVLVADFDHGEPGESYLIRIRRGGPRGRVVAKLPLTIGPAIPAAAGGLPVEASYRKGVKFLDGEAIAARHRLTFHGDDGFTVHTATLWADGTSSCNCPRWCRKLEGRERSCPHSARALTLTADVDETGDQPDRPPPAAGESPRGTNPFRRRHRQVDT